jgi:hypothetical protein
MWPVIGLPLHLTLTNLLMIRIFLGIRGYGETLIKTDNVEVLTEMAT